MNKLLVIAFLLSVSGQSFAQSMTGLFCKYDFNGNDSRIFSNSTIHNSSYNNANTTVDRFGNPNSAYVFTAANNQIITYQNSTFTPIQVNDFSISLWVKLKPSNNAQRAIISHYYSNNCGDNREFALMMGADNKVVFSVYESGSNPKYNSYSFGQITDTLWHHIVVGYKLLSPTSNNFISYIDGVVQNSTLSSNYTGTWSGVTAGIARCGIGSFPQVGTGACATNSPFDGVIDDIYFYSGLLTPTQVAANYNAGNYTTSRVRYVDKNASGANSGDSWSDAYTDIDKVFSDYTISGDTVFVMEGVYKPSPTGYEVVTNNLTIYGGFSTGGLSLATRDWKNHKTIFDGDINDDDIYPMNNANLATLADNVPYVLNITAPQTVIDGFHIRGGNGAAVFSKDHANGSYIVLRNSEISESSHTVLADHVGLYVSESNGSHIFKVENCHFHDLYGRYYTPFFFRTSSTSNLDVIFVNNLVENNYALDLGSAGTGTGAGGGFTAFDTSVLGARIINSTFANNRNLGTNVSTNETVVSASVLGTASALNMWIDNSIFWGNDASRCFNSFASSYNIASVMYFRNNITEDLPNSSYATSFSTTGGLQQDPLFADTTNRDFSLLNNSPAINVGDLFGVSSHIPMFDIHQMNRIFGIAIDLGAIENQSVTAVDLLGSIEQVTVFPNPAKDYLQIEGEGIESVKIFSTNGTLLQTIQNPSNQISIATLPQGIFVIEVRTATKMGMAKFIKE